MTAATTTAPAPAPEAPQRRFAAPAGGTRTAILIAAVFFVLAASARILDAPDLLAFFSFGAALRFAIPILLAGLGGLYAERAGIVNVGLEGQMALGTFFAGWMAWQYGAWWGIAGGLIGGALFGLLHAIATVTFGVDQVVSGVAINLLGPGTARYLAAVVFDGRENSSAALGPSVTTDVGVFTMPFLSGGNIGPWKSPDIAAWIMRREWFFISDVAALLKGTTTNLSWTAIIALSLVPISAYVLWRTPFGLRLRSSGEKPSAAESLGVNVYRIRYIACMISGALAGLAGSWLVLDAGANRFQDGQTIGIGFLGLAALIFGNWRPAGILAGALVFGLGQSLAAGKSAEAQKAVVLTLAIGVALAAVWLAVRAFRSWQHHDGGATGARRIFDTVWPPVAVAAVAAVMFAYFATVTKIPDSFVAAAPYLTTLLVLAFASGSLRPPAMAGAIWRRGQTS
jgi:ABC-type uncharacterized transport system permease subunit